MHLDTWILIAAWQLLLASWVAAGYFWWRGRHASAESQKVAEQCAAAEAALEAGKKLLAAERSKDGWQEHLRERLKVLKGVTSAPDTAEGKSVAAHRLVLEHELSSAAGAADLASIVGQATGEGGQSDPVNAELAALREEKDALTRKLAEQAKAPTESASDRERELKGLVQQFTHDSREMLSCIQKLESENTELRQQIRQHSKDAA